MKLTIEHVCGYIPFILKVQVNDIETNESRIDVVECISNELITFKDSPDWYFDSLENDTGIKLILTRVEDMSDEQLKELQCLWFGLSRDIYEETFDEIRFGVKDIKRNITQGSGVRYSTFKNNKHVQTGTLSFEMLNVYQFNYLHSQHIDIHGLIENGLAIDSKTLNQ